ncbi:hypothetical protein K1719_040789 [Acacia pycnantha]|nr:hypothetical protein K1719_040789 [Acacia pycnantha]
MVAYTSPIASYSTTLEEGSLSFEVHGVSASFEDGTVILYASFQLPGIQSRAIIGTLSKNIGSSLGQHGSIYTSMSMLAYIIGTIGVALGIFLSSPSLSPRLHMVLFMPPLESPCLSLQLFKSWLQYSLDSTNITRP